MADKEKRIFLFFLLIFFVFCALFASQKIVSYDDWWHLKTGEWIWQNKAIPHVDPFSYTFKGVEWIDFEWLFQALIYPIYQLGGFGGMIIFKIVIVALTFVVLLFTCREVDGGKRWLTLTILFVALLVARGRFFVRPQVISLLFLALYLYLFTLHQGDKITTRQLILILIPAHILWVNFHGSFLLGIFLAGTYVLGRFVPLALSNQRDLTPVFKDKRLQSLLIVCLILVVASLVNPYTYRAFIIPFRTAGSETLRGIAEWIPSTDIRFLGVFVIEPSMWFRLLFLVGVVSFFIRLDNLKKVEHIVIFAFFSYMAFRHIRFSGDFAIVAAPIITSNLIKLQWHVRKWRWLLLLLILIVIAFAVRDVRALIKEERLGLGVWRNYPETTVNFLKEHSIKGKIFNSYGCGGYLIWHLWPDIPVFIDGRTPTVYDQDFFWLYTTAEQKREVWEKVLEHYEVEIILVLDHRERGYAPFFHWLDEDEHWMLVAFDDVSSLYMRRESKFDNLTKQYGFHYLRPAFITMEYAKQWKRENERYLEGLEKELNMAVQRFPHDFYPFYYLGIYHQLYGTKEHFHEAEEALRKAIANRSYYPQGYYELGFTLMNLKRYDEAAKALKKAIRLSSHVSADSYYNLGICFFEKGEMDKAIKYLEKYKDETGFETKTEAYRLLGKAYLQRHKLQKALSCFERVGYLEKHTWDTMLNMGAAYFGLDKLEQARECFEEANELNPGALKVVYNLAVVYEKLGFPEKAKKMYEEASQISPQTPEDEIYIQKAKEKLK